MSGAWGSQVCESGGGGGTIRPFGPSAIGKPSGRDLGSCWVGEQHRWRSKWAHTRYGSTQKRKLSQYEEQCDKTLIKVLPGWLWQSRPNYHMTNTQLAHHVHCSTQHGLWTKNVFSHMKPNRQTRVESSALSMWFASKEADYQQEQMHCHNPESDSSALTAGRKVASQLRN